MHFIEASISSGKTTMIAKTALSDLKMGNTVVVAVPSHAAAGEVDGFVADEGGVGDAGTYVHLAGRRQETCKPEYYQKDTACGSCPIQKEWLGKDIEQRVDLQKRLKGGVFDIKALQSVANEQSTPICPRVLSKVLAASPTEAEIPCIVTVQFEHLYSSPANRVLRDIAPDRTYVDEADLLGEKMHAANTHRLQIGGFRGNRNRLHSACDPSVDCRRCRIHFSESVTGRRVHPSKMMRGDRDEAQRPRNFLDPLRNAIHFIRDEIADGNVRSDAVDLAAADRTVDRIGEMLECYTPPKKGEPAWKTLQGLEAAIDEKRVKRGWDWLEKLNIDGDFDVEDDIEVRFLIRLERIMTEDAREAAVALDSPDDGEGTGNDGYQDMRVTAVRRLVGNHFFAATEQLADSPCDPVGLLLASPTPSAGAGLLVGRHPH